MLKANKKELKSQYLLTIMNRMQSLIPERENFCTQKEAARAFGVSERKIQMFEQYKCTDTYLVWCYSKHFKTTKP